MKWEALGSRYYSCFYKYVVKSALPIVRYYIGCDALVRNFGILRGCRRLEFILSEKAEWFSFLFSLTMI
ncbi:hypothetical protein [Bacillus sp. 196mf]|uniref:hypothetical protein n=1 Tax=Bacillus sp. 196mf TaxID=1761754 RepID=UPI000D98B050|nr:hypothetical protein [Bacillus sp. 196mf]PYE96174.1 hypothetical protein ATL10_100245 [Bacillus sp. 196mf]